ncbi:hypothetical protein E5Q_04991 [Mixia osmundae IAM 14324]|uniref:Uncharacterized protein n=1 Tax=Mixia osmundae (strain CBS 9802 / IAM 14324 / JCM 22182 / KY 12970) TaxID=764103 RepID=G7E647_MIXOS|nr:hypothetical protein E5Q_04991 [Mixia osmundae IAM 14324]
MVTSRCKSSAFHTSSTQQSSRSTNRERKSIRPSRRRQARRDTRGQCVGRLARSHRDSP